MIWTDAGQPTPRRYQSQETFDPAPRDQALAACNRHRTVLRRRRWWRDLWRRLLVLRLPSIGDLR